MKVLKIILGIIVVVVGGYCIWMATLPNEFKVERETVIEAKSEVVYAAVSDFKTWEEWSPWAAMDPDAEITYGEKSQGEGASYTWKGEEMGEGEQMITAAKPNEMLETHIEFKGMGGADGQWRFEEVDGGKTKVSWGFNGKMPFLFRSMIPGIEKQTGNDFERGLENLKAMLETMPKNEMPDYEISMMQMPEIEYYGIREEDVPFEKVMGDSYFPQQMGELSQMLGKDMANMNGAPMSIYEEWDEENEVATVTVAVPISSNKAETDRVKKGTIEAGPVAKLMLRGSYENMEAAHNAMGAYLEKNELEFSGYVIEKYLVTPMDFPDDPSKWETEIIYQTEKMEAEDAEA